MEAEAFEEELTCAVCLHVYQDPVILPCQHSFCLNCINNTWKDVSNKLGVNCPQCRRTFKPKPQLQKNFTLRNIVEKYHQSQVTAAESTPVMCEYCMENPSPAVKTCLKCDTSFCSLHLKPHLVKKTYQDHILIEPLDDLTKKQCLDHKKILEFYCEQDEQCVCISCTVIGKHKSHTLLSLDQAEAKVKDKLKKEWGDHCEVQNKFSTDQEDLKKAEDEVKTRSNELREQLSKKFSEWRKQLEEDETYAIKLINDEENRVLSDIRSKATSLEEKLKQIKLIHIETEKQLKMDCLSFLQGSKQLLSRISQMKSDMGAVDDCKTSIQSKTFGLSPNQVYGQKYYGDDKPYWNRTKKNDAQYQQASSVIFHKPNVSSECSRLDCVKCRSVGTQNMTLNLSNVYQLMWQRMNQSQMYQSAVLDIINGSVYN